MYKNYTSKFLGRDAQLGKGTNTVSTTNLLAKSSICLLMIMLVFCTKTFGQNISSVEGVNWVGQINGYSQPTNLSADYRVLTYRKVSTTTSNPTDGRGQWTNTVNVQSSGGNVTPLNMTGGAGAGFLFTSGPSAGQYNNKWAFSGAGSGALDAVNGMAYQGSSDMGLNMSTAGYYTFVFKDAGYVATGYYVGYTASAPVTVAHTQTSQLAVMGDRSAQVSFTLGATPSAQEKFYVRYRTTTNDFSSTSNVVQATVVGTTATATIPTQTAGTVVYYYVFSSTMSLASITGGAAGDIAYEALKFADNSGSNYSYTANPIQVTSTTGTSTSATYTTFALALAAINGGTVHTGTITCKVGAGYTETATAGGFSITATGTVSTPITIVKSGTGTNPTFNAGVGTTTTTDAIIKIIGGDYITIDGFSLLESAGNTTTTTQVEWGIALLYATATNGAQNVTIQNNTITLNRTNANTFGIYSNSTHTATAVGVSATATGTGGGNSGSRIYSNTISNVNQGIVIVGPTAAADANTGIEIGGSSLGNSITNFGTTTTASYINVSGTVNGILVRNSNGFTISNNTITSSVGGTTLGTLNGIQVPAASNAPTTTFTNNINSNTISLQSGLAAGGIVGISYPSGSASATSVLNVNSNNFATFGHTVAGASGTITFITVTSTNLTTSISSNTFTNMSVNTTPALTKGN